LATVLLLKSEPNFLALSEPVELARVCGKDLEIPLIHDDPASGAIQDADLTNRFLWRLDRASGGRLRPGWDGVRTESDEQKSNQRNLYDHGGILQFE
jgi:hypothetical protein